MATFRILFVGAAAGLLALACSPLHAAEPTGPARTTSLDVMLDYAKLASVPDGTQTLIIGNPMVADASVQRNNVMVITGKSYGATNILALDRNGRALEQINVRVARGRTGTLTVQRGEDRETYACMPRCEQVLTLGDSANSFGPLSTQINARNSAAGAH